MNSLQGNLRPAPGACLLSRNYSSAASVGRPVVRQISGPTNPGFGSVRFVSRINQDRSETTAPASIPAHAAEALAVLTVLTLPAMVFVYLDSGVFLIARGMSSTWLIHNITAGPGILALDLPRAFGWSHVEHDSPPPLVNRS